MLLSITRPTAITMALKVRMLIVKPVNLITRKPISKLKGMDIAVINEARKVYSLYGQPDNIGFFNHRTGHTPTPEAVSLALRWFERFLGPGN